MLSDLDLVNITASLYDPKETWGRFFTPIVYGGVKCIGNDTVLVFRGSTTPRDWWEDFETSPINDTDLGILERGFSDTMREAVTNAGNLNTTYPGEFYITGHSLGAARAFIAAGYLQKRQPIVRVFGAPRPGGLQLKSILSSLNIRSYRNRRDPVCDVPIELPGFPYVEPCEFTELNVEPTDDDQWGLLADHHIELYQRGVATVI